MALGRSREYGGVPGSTWAWRAITLLAAGVLGAGVAVAFLGPERQTRRGGDSPAPAPAGEPGAPAPSESPPAGLPPEEVIPPDATDTDGFGEPDGFTETGFGATDDFSETDFGLTDGADDGFVLPGEIDAGFAESEP